MANSPLLINEHPLQVLPTLAVALGLNEAMILQQIHFWLCNKDKRNKPYVNENETWVYNTYEEWHEQFPFWSVPTIKRAILKLEGLGLLVTRQFDLKAGDAKKYYTVNYEKLNEKLSAPSDQIDLTPSDQLNPTRGIKLIPPSDQIDPIMIGSKRSHLIRTETTSETASETTSTPSAEPTKTSEVKPEKPKNPFCESFRLAYESAYSCPYQSKAADFVQLAACRKTGGEWLTPDRWQIAVGNYFASELGNHTLADLSARFGAFFRSRLDRFGKPMQAAGQLTQFTDKTRGNYAAAQAWLAKRGQTLEGK